MILNRAKTTLIKKLPGNAASAKNDSSTDSADPERANAANQKITTTIASDHPTVPSGWNPTKSYAHKLHAISTDRKDDQNCGLSFGVKYATIKLD